MSVAEASRGPATIVRAQRAAIRSSIEPPIMCENPGASTLRAATEALPFRATGVFARSPLGRGARSDRESSMAKPKTKTTVDSPVTPALDDPLAGGPGDEGSGGPVAGPYDLALAAGEELRRKPYAASSTIQTIRQHTKDRMTVWERIEVLQDPDTQPTVLYQNWG